MVRAADRVTMPWKNGGGVTHELVREGEGAAGFGVRLSIAEVAAEGPFSRFPGVDRVILLLRGAGFRLRRDDGRVVTMAQPGEPFAFAGEDAWDCTLPGGPVTDFNVMTDRETVRASVAVRGPGRVDGRWVLALADGLVSGVPLVAWDLAELDATGVSDVPCVVIAVALARGGSVVDQSSRAT
ncbi:MAG: HutD family protein [Pseudomonadota bacterium]|nr:HutD family protein [Pseudomonadota bacterium]